MSEELSTTLIEKLLDWPVLLTGFCIYVLARHGEGLKTLLEKRKLEVELGGNKFSLGDAIENVNENLLDDLATIQEKFVELDDRVKALEAGKKIKPAARGASADTSPSLDDDAVFQRLLEAISSGPYRWRSIERLAIKAGVSAERAHAILAQHEPKQVILGKGKSGRIIARLPGS